MSNASSAKGSSAVGLGAEERLRMFKAVWSATARDYRGTTEDGAQAVLAHAKFGTGFVTAKTISEDELRERYAATQKKVPVTPIGSTNTSKQRLLTTDCL